MSKELSKEEVRTLLRKHGLRVTASRLDVVAVLAKATHPLSCAELLAMDDDTAWDSSTTYRTLKTLVEEGLAVVASRIDGIDRYALTGPGHETHAHAHFVCNDCGEVSCLPELASLSARSQGRWAASVKKAEVQLRGECPDCLAS